MRANHAVSMALAALGVTALSLAGTAAAAATASGDGITSFGFQVSPGAVAPGGSVSVVVWGCQEGGITASSELFDTVPLDQGVSRSVEVGRHARPGARYDVTFTCGDETAHAPLAVEDSHSWGGVAGGLGGSRGPRPGAEALAGGLLLAAGLGAGGGYALRRRAHR